MARSDLIEACTRAGIAPAYHDALGVWREVPDATLERLLQALGAPTQSTTADVAAPPCYRPEWMMRGERAWGVAVQLYSLRSERNWGIGDFGDLRRLIELVAAAGGDVIALNPLHALFAAEPRRISPYAPASREFLNVLYIDVAAMQAYRGAAAARETVDTPEFQETLAGLRRGELVDHAAVSARKEVAFRAIFGEFERVRAGDPEAPLAHDFDRYLRERGQPLLNFATYQTLSAAAGYGTDWRRWPEGYRNPGTPDVAAFQQQHAGEIRYHQFLQWEAEAQLAGCAGLAREAGMRLGLCIDLAVGAEMASGEGWAEQGRLIAGFHVGAPPDAWNESGQDWGLAAANPLRIPQDGAAAFRRMLRANMRHAGALRIDHVLGLSRLFLVPAGGRCEDGAYLRFPLEALYAALAAESKDNDCLIIGEDLGTVPEGFRERMSAQGILAYRLLIFGTDGEGRFLLPEAYSADALAAFSTHDLPTFRGYMEGRDLATRAALGLYPDDGARARAAAARETERQRLIDALRQIDPAAASSSEALLAAAYQFLARTHCRLFLAQMEDLAGDVDQPNLPGTADEYPNWRRKLSRDLEEIFAGEGLAELLRRVRAERPRADASAS
jgi:(1->4)-alpha-D-glucan 1-alpha-D-glucosylmutase